MNKYLNSGLFRAISVLLWTALCVSAFFVGTSPSILGVLMLIFSLIAVSALSVLINDKVESVIKQ